MDDDGLSGEQRAFRDAARAFARAASSTPARERLRDLGRLGFLGIPFPSAIGGQDGDLLSFCLCIEAFAERDPDLAHGVAAAVCLGILPIAALATAEQRRRLLPPLLGGGATAGLASGAGGTLAPAGSGWILDAPATPLEGWLPAHLAIRPVRGPGGPGLVVLPVPPPGDVAPIAVGEPIGAEAVLGPPVRVAGVLADARDLHRIARAAADAAGDGPHRALARSHARMVAIAP